MKSAIILGTRPEIIKLSPIIKKLNKKNSVVIFTGQHYDYELSKIFFNDLGIRQPDYFLKIDKTHPGKQIGQLIIKLSDILQNIDPENVIVQGDTNTALSGGLSAIKCKIPLFHIESGLRSCDWRMPEEHNRITVDHMSDLLFSPTNYNKEILIDEINETIKKCLLQIIQ